jgi:restriction system protein
MMLYKGMFQQLMASWHAFAILIALSVVAILLKKRTVKGWIGEKVTSAGMWALLDKNKYRRIDDVIIPASDGTTQIDHVLVSKYGIFVIETKNYQGWIYGNPQDDKWTQNIYGKKNQFQNPIKQNYRHTKCLAEFLKIDDGLVKPMVFFIGNCEFKTPMPSNVLNGGLIPYIREFTEDILTAKQVEEIEGNLLKLKQDKSLNLDAHLESLRKRHESTTTCPKCGGQLIERVAKKGSSAGKSFLGCSNYPRCKYIK